MCTTYIIIGGKSSRMGIDKATLIVKGNSFLNRVIEATIPLKTPIKLVSSLTKHKDLKHPVISDIENNKGPVSAITSALSNTKTELNLILSCDIPLLQNNLLDWLLKQHNLSYKATIVCYKGKKMPLIGVYSKSCFKIFENHLNNNQLKLMRVLDDLNVNYIEVPSVWKKQIMNINTPEELKAIEL